MREPAVEFWLRWAESEGALYDTVGDLALAVLPAGVRDRLGLPEEVALTSDPEVAREDGALLLAGGHPVLDHATEAVLSRGDVDIRTLAAPSGAAPDERSLLARVREAFPVDHGRIDLAESPQLCRVPVLRVGALITYSVALDERFQEQAEAWVDVRAAASLPSGIASRLAQVVQYPAGVEPEPDGLGPQDLDAAVHIGHQQLEQCALGRRRVLSGQLAGSRDDELARTRSYYQAMLAGLARRRLASVPERRGALDAKAEAVQAERDRRLAEVEDKFRPSHGIRPFRLHLLWVPALRLAVRVHRGPRQYPMVLHWLRPAAAFTPAPCPGCGGPEPWVAGKRGLGCRDCLPQAAIIPARRPSAPEPATIDASGRASRQAPAPASPATPAPRLTAMPPPPPTRRGATVAPPAARASGGPPRHGRAGERTEAADTRVVDAANRRRLGAAGDKLGLGLWQAALDGPRRLRRLLAPDSPAAALHRLYGAPATIWALGIPADDLPVAVSASTIVHADGRSGRTSGVVESRRATWPYTLRWDVLGGRPAVTELLAVPLTFQLRLPWLDAPGMMPTGLRRPPIPQLALDPVAEALWVALLPRGGLLLVARCLAAYWRLGEVTWPSSPAPTLLAAALAHQVGRRAGLAITYQQAAADFRVSEDQLRATGTKLARALGLSATCVW